MSENIVQWTGGSPRNEAVPLGHRFHFPVGPRGPAFSTYSGAAPPDPTLAPFVSLLREDPMSPLMMRFFTLVGIALAAASMQLKARAAESAPVLAPVAVVTPAAPRSR